MENRTVLISGASIAGPALAFWLRRYGFTPTLVERAPGLRSGGQAIDLRGAARDAAERMGLMPQIRQAHTGAKGMHIVNRANKRLASMGADLLGHSGGVIADIEIQRGDLARILFDATASDAEYIFGDSIASLAQGADGVLATFERGSPRHFDLVIGADGVHSHVRSLVFGEEAHFVKPLGCYVAIFTTPTTLDLSGWERVYAVPGSHGARGKSATLYPMREPGQAKAMLYFTASSAEYDRHDLSGQKRLVASAFAGEGWEVPNMLKGMWDAPDFYFDGVAQVHLAGWAKGRVALLGDAADCPSPMSGMGTSLALVGAYVLAGELAAAGGDYALAYASYEREMHKYVRLAQGMVKGAYDFLLPKSQGQMRLNHSMFRMLPYLPWKGVIAREMTKPHTAITLKDYRRFEVVAPPRAS